jgi:hypothetical protein
VRPHPRPAVMARPVARRCAAPRDPCADADRGHTWPPAMAWRVDSEIR